LELPYTSLAIKAYHQKLSEMTEPIVFEINNIFDFKTSDITTPNINEIVTELLHFYKEIVKLSKKVPRSYDDRSLNPQSFSEWFPGLIDKWFEISINVHGEL
jgi:hypothetical protein